MVLEDGAGDHHRQSAPGLLEILVDGEEARLHHQRVERRFGQEDVHAAFHQGADLLRVDGDHLVKGDVTPAGVVADGERQSLVRGADAAGHEARLVRRAAAVLVGGAAGQAGGGAVDLGDVLLQLELAEVERVAVEGVGRNDVGPGLQVGAVDVLDDLGLREDHHLGAILEQHGVVAEAGAAVVGFLWLVREDHRPHRSVEDEDAAGEEVFQVVARADVGGAGHEASGSCKGVTGWAVLLRIV